jgi:hypothetical protein
VVNMGGRQTARQRELPACALRFLACQASRVHFNGYEVKGLLTRRLRACRKHVVVTFPIQRNVAGICAASRVRDPMAAFDLFLSYHWRNHDQVETLARRLQDAGTSVFLDRWYLAPGANWVAALESTLANCKAVAVCIGEEMGPWQLRECYAALERQVAEERRGAAFAVIPVLLPGGDPPPGFLSQNTWVDLRERLDDPVHLAVLAKAIRGEPPGPDAESIMQLGLSQVCPYRGLLYFREEDAEYFFGREAVTRQLEEAIAQHSLVAMVGSSGSGKSSVVRAGLIPALRKNKTCVWEVATILPGDRPLHALAASLVPLLEPGMSEVTRLGEINRLADQLRAGGIALRDVVDRALARQAGTDRLLLVVDQWEELFTLTHDEAARQCFVNGILESTERSKLSVVITLRGDFFGRAVTEHRLLSDRVQNALVNLAPMNESELRRSIEEPARKVGIHFEPGLVDTLLVEAIDEPGSLPLLEFVLRQLWERRQGGLLHYQAYAAIGKLAGAIAQKADDVYDSVGPPEQRALQRIFTRLVHAGEGEHDTRRRAAMAEFGVEDVALIRELSDARLLVTSKSATGFAETVEVAHEALIRHWQRLRHWIDTDRQFIAWQQDVNATARNWDANGRRADFLLRGLTLAQANDWYKKKPDAFSELEFLFVSASHRKRLRSRIAGIGLVLCAVILASALYADKRDATERQLQTEIQRRERQMQEYATYYRGQQAQMLSYQNQMRLLQGYEQFLPLAEKMANANSTSHDKELGLSAIYELRGDGNFALANYDAARSDYERSLAIAERLSVSDPTNRELLGKLAIRHTKLSDTFAAQDQRSNAIPTLESALKIYVSLMNLDPSNARWKDDAERTQARIAALKGSKGDLTPHK